MMPVVARGLERTKPLAPGGLWRDRGIVDQRMQLAIEAPLGFRDCRRGVFGIGQIDLNVVFGAGFPRAIFRKRMPRAGDDAPAGRRETLDGGMADAAACPGQEQRAARLIACGHTHHFTLMDTAASWSTARLNPRA